MPLIEGKPPSLPEWRKLYESAMEFKKLGPWEWMHDSDIFGVKNPANGEIGYCCIMGNLGEHYALSVYLGTEGLEGYFSLLNNEGLEDPKTMILSQKFLMISFEDRKYLAKNDLDIIKNLGLKFRGRNSWPLFRSYIPGYQPWFLTADEAEFLNIAIEQAMDVAKRFEKDEDLLESVDNETYLVRVAESSVWKDKWLSPEAYSKPKILPEPDEKPLEKLKNLKPGKMILEVDYFYVEQGVRENNERPYYPNMLLWADHKTGLLLNFSLEKSDQILTGFVDNFIKVCEILKFMPVFILFRRNDLLELFKPWAGSRGIRVELVNNLEAIDESRNFMGGF